jgi:formiminotetrahydrofolate cyclodeaminase
MAAYKLPKGTPEEQSARTQQIEVTTFWRSGYRLGSHMAVEVMELAVQAVSLGNPTPSATVPLGAQARASLAGAAYNVRINLKELQNYVAAQAMLAELRELEMRGARLEERVRMELVGRGGMPQG